jgi:hypothetical protein
MREVAGEEPNTTARKLVLYKLFNTICSHLLLAIVAKASTCHKEKRKTKREGGQVAIHGMVLVGGGGRGGATSVANKNAWVF